MTTLTNAQFLRDIAWHHMHIIRDDGLYRHIRFKVQGSMFDHFDLITWPGSLCYTGDMGTYVFQRLPDMFEFFRCDPAHRSPGQIDFRYWAEKTVGADRDGIKEWTLEQFKDDVMSYVNAATDDWPDERKADLLEAIQSEVLTQADDDGEHGAINALREFERPGFDFNDWDSDSRTWTHRFLWCCYALEWAIGVYDAAKSQPTDLMIKDEA